MNKFNLSFSLIALFCIILPEKSIAISKHVKYNLFKTLRSGEFKLKVYCLEQEIEGCSGKIEIVNIRSKSIQTLDKVSFIDVNLADINFDKFPDIEVYYDHGATGNEANMFYLYNKEKQKYIYCESCYFGAVSLCPKDHILKSWSKGGCASLEQSTELFKMNDSAAIKFAHYSTACPDSSGKSVETFTQYNEKGFVRKSRTISDFSHVYLGTCDEVRNLLNESKSGKWQNVIDRYWIPDSGFFVEIVRHQNYELPVNVKYLDRNDNLLKDFGRKYSVVDSELNSNFKQLKQMISPKQKKELVNSQRNWIKSRDSLISSLNSNSTDLTAPILVANRIIELTLIRSNQLRDSIKTIRTTADVTTDSP